MDFVKEFLQSMPDGSSQASLIEAWDQQQSKVAMVMLDESTIIPEDDKVEVIDPEKHTGDSTGTGATYRESKRNWLYRKFDDNETIVVLMDNPSHAGIINNDQTTNRLNKIIPYNDYGSYHLLNVSIQGWEKDLEDLSKLTDKIVIGWGASRRDKKETQHMRIMIQEHYKNIYQFQAKGKENMPTRLKFKTKIVPLEW